MKMLIKEMKERGEKDDEVKFLAKVKDVYPAKDLTPEQRVKAKYTVSRQNIIVEDDTDKIQIIISHKEKEFEYTQDIIGKEVEISGKISLWEGKVNIFGKLIFENEPKKKTSSGPKPVQAELMEAETAGGITREEIRLKCINYSLMLYKSETEVTTKEIIAAAKLFEGYVSQEGIIPKKQTTRKKEDNPKENKESGNNNQLSVEHISKINTLMALVENRGEAGKVIISEIILKKGYRTVKEFTEADMKEASKLLESIGTSDIPF